MRQSGPVSGLVCLWVLLLSTGLAHGQCAGTIVVWGSQGDVPAPNADFVAVAGGYYHSLGLKSDGTIVAWGHNYEGQCNVPEPNADFMAIAGAGHHSLGLKSDGKIVAWGDSSWAQCNVPEPNANFMAIAGGYYHSLGLKSDGKIVAWGDNRDGQCNVPTPNADFAAVADGYHHSLGLKSDGTIMAWGRNNYGQCNVPTPNADFVAIAGGAIHSLGLKSDGKIVAWGFNGFHQCNVPAPNADFVAVAGGVWHSLGLKSDGKIVAWGDSSWGQCNVPAPNADFVAVAAGGDHSLGIRCVYALVACVDIDPDILNPRSAGRWVTAYVELPEGYDPVDIDVSTVILNDTVPAELHPTSVGDYDDDGIPDRTVKFSRAAVIDTLPNGEQVEVCVGGEVAGQSFEGCDTIRVLMPKVTYPNGGETLEVGQQCLITWEHPPGYEADWFSVYYTLDDAESWNVIALGVEGTSCTWVIPDDTSDRCCVLVEAYDAEGIMGYDMSDQSFTVCAGAGIPREEAVLTSFALHPANPNPFTQGTLVSFDLPCSRHVKLTIHDVRGRLVQELIDEVRPAESYSVQWDGRDSFGVEVPAGIYFVHLKAGDYEATGKIVLVR